MLLSVQLMKVFHFFVETDALNLALAAALGQKEKLIFSGTLNRSK